MTFKFSQVVELLERLDGARFEKAVTGNRPTNPDYQVVKEWFRTHDRRISRHGRAAVALLSCLFPQRLSQRSYNVRERSLSHIIPRILIWGSSRAQALRDWKDGSTEFAVLIESEMRRTESASPRSPRAVTVEEVDAALLQLAANSPYSGPKIRKGRNSQDACEILAPMFRRLKSHEAKWLVRIMLKDFRIIQVPEKLVMESFHFLLPDLLTVANDLDAAVEFLSRQSIRDWPHHPSPAEAKRLKHEASKIFQPEVGTMIPRMTYDKARSIKHAVNLANNRVMSVERKYDGEYCQVHIQRENDKDTIQIFSKSGKDSTLDRQSLHRAITLGLDLAGDSCRIQSSCVLEGELLVWSKSRGAIEPFYKIRNHVKHGGKFMGNANDPTRDPEEHLMIIFYDVLVLDSEVNTTTPQETRRQHLKSIIKVIPGVSDVVERRLIDFKHLAQPRTCTKRLREFFARAIVSNWEGLVLKGRDDPYLSFVSAPRGIKLKRDYLAQLGDAVDLCIVGARLDPRIDNPDRLKWNTFYLACINNKEAVERFGEAPSFSIVDRIHDAAGAIPREDLLHLSKQGAFYEAGFGVPGAEFEVTMLMQGEEPTVLFRKPFVVECLGAGFDKNSDCAFWTLRFPRLTRIHHDRPVTESMSYTELQQAAETAHIGPALVDEQEVQRWIARLSDADGKKLFPAARLTSQSTASTSRTPHSATTASLSPVAPRNRPPSLPLIWKDAARPTPVPERTQRHDPSQNTATTSTRTPSTTGASISIQPAGFAVLAAVPELEQEPAASRLQTPPLSSPTPAGPGRGKKRGCDAVENALPSKRQRVIAGRTILETPTPPRHEIDLTRDDCSVSPSAAPVVARAASSSSPQTIPTTTRIGHLRDCSPIPIPLPKAKVPQPPVEAETGGSCGPFSAPNREAAPQSSVRRMRTSISSERRPLAELPNKSPMQREAPPPSPRAPSPSAASAQDREKFRVEKDTKTIPHKIQQHRQVLDAAGGAAPPSALLTPPSTEEAARKEMPHGEPAPPREGLPPPRETHKPAEIPKVSNARPPSHKDRVEAERTRNGGRQQAERLGVAEAVPGTPTTSPILRMPSASDEAGPISELMSRTSSTFTQSQEMFLARVMQCASQKHVVLVDSANAREVAREVMGIAKAALRLARGADLDGQVMICFFDWRILGCLKRKPAAGTGRTGRKHEHFVCAVYLGGDIVGGKGRMAARIAWRH